MNIKSQKTEWVAEQIRLYMYNKRTTMRGISDLLKVSPQYLSAIINGKKSISDNFINKIENITGNKFGALQIEKTPTPTNTTQETITANSVLVDYVNELKTDKKQLIEIINDMRTILKNLTEKTKTVFLFALMAGTLTAMAQPKNATTCVVGNALTASDNYTLTGKTLVQNGWAIAAANVDFGAITTAPRTLGNVVVILNIVCVNGQITTTGTFTAPGITSTPAPIKNKGMNKSPANNAWQHMHATAQLFGTGMVYH